MGGVMHRLTSGMNADNAVVWQDDQIWQNRPSLRRMTSGKESGAGQLCHPSVLVSSMRHADANPTSQGDRSPYSRLCAGWMMGNETSAEKESDAWMMRLAKTMRRVAERVVVLHFAGVVTVFSTWMELT